MGANGELNMKNKKTDDNQKSKDQSPENPATTDVLSSDAKAETDQAPVDANVGMTADNGPNGDATPEEELKDPLVAMTAERDKLKDQLLRAMADTENMRRRSEREAASVRKYGHTPFARDLVGAIDNLARAVESAPDDLDTIDESAKSLITGIQLSWTELQSVIEKHGIKRVDPLGEKFDYNLHQAMFEVPTNEQPSGLVLEVVQHGYVLHDRLLRPAMVGVSKTGEPASSDNDKTKTND